MREEEMSMLDMSGADVDAMSAEADAAAAIADVGAKEDEANAAMAPVGDFSKAALNSLVKAHNKVTALFEGTETYPEFEDDQETFPGEFVRELMMISQAVDDAIAAGLLEGDMAIDLDGVAEDRDLAMLAGRLDQIAKSKDFKRLLKEQPGPEEEGPKEEPAEEVPEGPTDEDLDALMSSRL